MTTTPSAPTAPLPPTPELATAPPATPAVQSLNLVPGTAPTATQGAAIETAQWTGKLKVGKFEYDLVTQLSALDMVVLQEAQESGQFRQIIQVVPRLVIKTQREGMLAYLLSEPVDAADYITLDDVLNALSDGLEQIGARPTDK